MIITLLARTRRLRNVSTFLLIQVTCCRGSGAVHIDGRGGFTALDPGVQNWDSAIDLTVLRCVFFRNFASYFPATLLVINAWPLTSTCTDTDFIQNDALGTVGDMYTYDVPVCHANPWLV